MTRNQSTPGAAPAAASRSSDLTRQIVVISAVSFAIVASIFGSGLVGGTNIRDVQGGALDSDGSLLAPGRAAFGIWSVIYAGLIAYAIWQALPSQRKSDRQRAVGWLIAGTAVLNGLWIVTAQYGELWMTVVGIVLLLALLCVTYRRTITSATSRRAWLEAVLIDGVTGAHLGWVSLATVANITALLTRIAPASWEAYAATAAIAVIAVVVVVGLATSAAGRWRLAPPLAMAWGLIWIAAERLSGEPASAPIGIAAAIAAGILLLVPVIARGVAVLREGGD